jgi:hypothetical protein
MIRSNSWRSKSLLSSNPVATLGFKLFAKVAGGDSWSSLRLSVALVGELSTRGQIDQPMGDDLSRFLDQFADNLTSRLDVMDQADALSCQQIH